MAVRWVASSSGSAKPSSTRRPSSGGMRSVRRSHSAATASARCAPAAPYSSSVPGRLCQKSCTLRSTASAAAKEAMPSEWFSRCAVT